MPIYEYRCENGHTFEVMQRISDDALEVCSICQAAVHRVFHQVAVHFKGSGFYNTDYGKKKGGGDGKPEPAKSDSDGASKDSKGSDSKGPSDSKPATAPSGD